MTSASANPGVRRILRVGAVVLATAAPVAAQKLGAGAMPPGVRLTLIHDDYLVGGTTAPEILQQMRTQGPRSGWTRYPYVYSWRYRSEVLPLANGLPSNRCRPIDLEMLIEVTATYPRWTRSPDASEEVASAWGEFAEQIELQWRQIRDDITGRAREADTRVRRFEDQCPFVEDRVNEMVIEAFDEPSWRTDDTPPLRLQWPPQGYEHLMLPETAPEVANEAGASGDDPVAGPAQGSADEPASADTADEPASAVAAQRPPPDPAVRPAPDIDVAARLDMERGEVIGLVVDLHHQGELQFKEAFGAARAGSDDRLDPDEIFAFPAFTELLIATLATTLASDGRLTLDAPISDHLPSLPAALGGVTLRQLLAHRAGLDNAMVPDTADWTRVIDRLDDRALFTEPGAVYSYSRYSYPLAARVLEGATGERFENAITTSLLEPLGLGSTSLGARDALDAREGLPVTHTTVDDVAGFWTAWIDERIPGAGPSHLDDVVPEPASPDGRAFLRGYWQDRIGDAPRISLVCGSNTKGDAAGFQVFPETRTIMIVWSRYDAGDERAAGAPPSSERWPRESFRFVLSRVAAALQMTDEVYRPTSLTGGAQPGQSTQRCAEPAVSERRVTDFGPRAPAEDWPGRYVNGDWFFELADRDGLLTSPVDPTREPYSVRHYDVDVYFTDIDIEGAPQIGFPLRLLRDGDGRRYLMLGDRAYLHTDDRGR